MVMVLEVLPLMSYGHGGVSGNLWKCQARLAKQGSTKAGRAKRAVCVWFTFPPTLFLEFEFECECPFEIQI